MTIRFFIFNDRATTDIYTLSLHDALPIFRRLRRQHRSGRGDPRGDRVRDGRVRRAAGDRASRGSDLVLELRLGASSGGREGEAGRGAAVRARAGAVGSWLDASRSISGIVDAGQ